MPTTSSPWETTMVMRDLPTPLALAQQRVLLVEDEPTIRILAESLLTRVGATVSCFASPLPALQAARSVAPTLLVTDLSMPELDGLELAFRLRTAFPRLKTLLMTGHSPDEREDLRELPSGVLLVSKPFSVITFYECLDQLIGWGA